MYLTRRGNPKTKANILFSDTKYFSKVYGLEFNLDKEWIRQRVSYGRCELTGISFKYEKIGYRRPLAPSIDRIDNTKGYIPENSRVVLSWINNAKNDLPEGLFEETILKVALKLSNNVTTN